MSKEDLIVEYVRLSLEDALDDVTVSRNVAISRQRLTPAPSPHPARQARFMELNAQLTPEDMLEVERRYRALLVHQTHFASGAEFEYYPTLVLHVGPGLDCCYVNDPSSPSHGLACLALNTTAELTLEGHMRRGAQLLVAPEVYRSEAKAARDVMRTFRQVREHDGAVLTVVTLSEGVVTAVVNAMIDIGFGHELMVCLHYDEMPARYTVHRIDSEGFLKDWPYGVLSSSIDSFLHELKFSELKRS